MIDRSLVYRSFLSQVFHFRSLKMVLNDTLGMAEDIKIVINNQHHIGRVIRSNSRDAITHMSSRCLLTAILFTVNRLIGSTASFA